jgi:hypothetical protein
MLRRNAVVLGIWAGETPDGFAEFDASGMPLTRDAPLALPPRGSL